MVSSFLKEIKGELASIQQLISVLLEKQLDLSERLTAIEEPGLPGTSTAGVASNRIPDPANVTSTAWSTVVAGGSRRSPPTPEHRGGDDPELELSNRFSPLADLIDSSEKRLSMAPVQSPSSPVRGDSTSTTVKPKGGCKATSKRNRSPSDDILTLDKRRRVSSSSSEVALGAVAAPDSLSPLGHGSSSPPTTVHPSDAGTNTVGRLLPQLPSPSASSFEECETASDNANSDSIECLKLPPRTTTHYDFKVRCNPEILIVGDSIVRHLILPGAITYSISGGKVSDISQLIPALLDWHPSINIVIIHVGTNDVMARSSLRLQDELETLCFTIESIGKRCIMSGPIPFNSNQSERFSRLYSLHNWLKNFCYAAGHDFISNFDLFWTNSSLYSQDGVHPNTKGIQQLTMNFIQFIAFSTP